jgi:hypothetical protein
VSNVSFVGFLLVLVLTTMTASRHAAATGDTSWLFAISLLLLIALPLISIAERLKRA